MYTLAAQARRLQPCSTTLSQLSKHTLAAPARTWQLLSTSIVREVIFDSSSSEIATLRTSQSLVHEAHFGGHGSRLVGCRSLRAPFAKLPQSFRSASAVLPHVGSSGSKVATCQHKSFEPSFHKETRNNMLTRCLGSIRPLLLQVLYLREQKGSPRLTGSLG